MITDKEYNDFFRSKLDNFSSDVPDHVWQNIQRKNKEERHPFITLAKYSIVLLFLVFTFHTTDMITDIADKHFIAKTAIKINKTKTGTFTELQDKITIGDRPESASILSENSKQNSKLFIIKNKLTNRKTNHDLPKTKSVTSSTATEPFYTTQTNETKAFSFSQLKDSALIDSADKTSNAQKNKTPKQADSTHDITVDIPEKSDRLFLYIFASPDVSFAHVTSANTAYEQLRNRQVSMQFSYTIGARLRVNINERLSGNIGVQYAQVNEKINMSNSASNNRYKSLDVPLIAGYQVYKNKFEIDANAGIILNVSSSYKGIISSQTNEPVNIQKDNIYRSNTALSYYGGLHFIFNPTHKMGLFAEPYFKYQPGSIANSFQPFAEHVSKAGLLLGARYRVK